MANLNEANAAVEKLNEFHALREEYAEVSKSEYFLSRDSLEKEAAARSKADKLKYIESRLADLKTAVHQKVIASCGKT